MAIYSATKISDTASYESNTKIAKQISIFIDPLQVGFATSSKGTIDFGQKIRLKNICENYTQIGSNSLYTSTLNTKKEYTDFGSSITVNDKYIFSKEILEGKKVYTLSRTFSYPYEVSDFIILISENEQYCFQNAPDEVINELETMQLDNLYFSDCASNSSFIQVCSEYGDDCDIEIVGQCTSFECSSQYDFGYIRKNREYYYYVEDLLYPAIFSDLSNYNCNTIRLVSRASILAELYAKKSIMMSSRGCVPNIDISLWSDKIIEMRKVSDIITFYPNTINLEKQNRNAGCNLW